MRHTRNSLAFVAFALFLSCGNAVARAADPMADIPVAQRQFDSFRAKGLVIGSLTLRPSLGTGVAYTDNIYQTAHNKRSDKILRLTPSVTGAMALGAGSRLSFDVQADHYRHYKENRRDYTDYHAAVTHMLPISALVDIEVGGAVRRDHEDQSVSAAAIGATVMPVRLDSHNVFARFIMKPARFVWEAGVAYTVKRFRDGQSVIGGTAVMQRDRDRRDITVDTRLRYKTGGVVQPFLGIRHSRMDFDRRDYIAGSGFTGVNQDRHRTDVTTGFDFTGSGKWRGQARAGYGYEAMDDATMDSRGSGLFGLDLTYLYSPLTNMRLALDRFFTNDTDAVEGVIETRLSAGVIHELTRQWILQADMTFTYRDFQGGDTDETTRAAIGVAYIMNRHARLSGEVTHTDRDSNRPNGDFLETQAMLHLEAAF